MRNTVLRLFLPLLLVVGVACAPAAAPAPTVAPSKPAASPAAASSPVAASPVAKPAPAGSPAAKPAASPAAPSPSPSPAAASRSYDQKAVADFFQGKTVRVVVGFGAGGGFDTIYRIWARHAGKHIPGNPTVIVENMTGAGGLVAANHIFKVAPKDGTSIGAFDLYTAVLGHLAGAPGIDFNPREFNWVGVPADETPSVCAIRTDLGFKTFTEYLRSGRELVMGASGRGNIFYASPNVAKLATGANIRVVDGYNGNPAVRLAVENKELDGACWTWSSMSTTAANWFEGDPPLMRPVLQTGKTPHPDLKDVELMRSFTQDPELTRMIDVLERTLVYVYMAALPPNVPADRVAALRDAWMNSWNDPALREDLAKTKLALKGASGEETERVVNEILAIPPAEGKRIGQVFGLIN